MNNQPIPFLGARRSIVPATKNPSPSSTLRIHDLPVDERPREKLAKFGPRVLSDAELLAIFFRTGPQGMSAVDLGRTLIDTHGSLNALSRCTTPELIKTRGIGTAKASELAAAFELGRRLARERFKNTRVNSPEAVCDLIGAELRALRYESLRVVLLDSRAHPIAVEEVFRGSINESLAHPREVLRPALIHAANAFILVHNHPSGDPSPSESDRQFTKKIVALAEEMELSCQDHIIIGLALEDREDYFSFRESGMM